MISKNFENKKLENVNNVERCKRNKRSILTKEELYCIFVVNFPMAEQKNFQL